IRLDRWPERPIHACIARARAHRCRADGSRRPRARLRGGFALARLRLRPLPAPERACRTREGLRARTGRVPRLAAAVGGDRRCQQLRALGTPTRGRSPWLFARGPGGAHRYAVGNTVLSADVILNVPKLKTHMKTGMTGALKNFVGIVGSKDFLPH